MTPSNSRSEPDKKRPASPSTEEPASAFTNPAIFMKGTWVSSFASFVHDLPIDKIDPYTPRLLSYRYYVSAYDYEVNPPKIQSVQRADLSDGSGYLVSVGILALKFKDNQELVGKFKVNRGGLNVRETGDITKNDADGNSQYEDFFPGDYTCEWNSILNTYEGEFATNFVGVGDLPDIYTRYYYIASGPDEIEWIWLWSAMGGKPFRANVARGSSKRVIEPFPERSA